MAKDQSGQFFAVTSLGGFVDDNWPGFEVAADAKTIDLDAVYSQILAASWIVLKNPGGAVAYKVNHATVLHEDFTLSAKISRLSLAQEEPSQAPFEVENRRTTEVLLQSEPLALFQETRPLSGSIQGDAIELDRLIPPLEAGRRIIVSGKQTDGDATDKVVSEIAFMSGTADNGNDRSIINLREPLHHSYALATVTIQANVLFGHPRRDDEQ